MRYTLEELQKMMDENNGNLYLSGTQITKLPAGLTVDGGLDLRNTQITKLPEGLVVAGSLYLSGTPITKLPAGLTVDGSLYLRNTPITELPEGLVVAGYLDLSGTQITKLPEGLTVVGGLDLSNTPITELPEGLVVAGYLNLSGTRITKLPEGLTVGGRIYCNPDVKGKEKVKRLKQGDYVEGRYIYADRILTLVHSKRKYQGYTVYFGKIKNQFVVSDGENYAHCRKIKDGIEDLIFKKMKERGAEQFKDLTLNSVVSFEQAKNMYRIITGACRAGTEQFIDSLPETKEQYTIAEMINLTKGQYGCTTFKKFFGN